MFSRGRPCLRRRLSAVLDTVAAGPDEPLLFLYPRWVAPVLQRRQPISSLTPAAIPSKAHQPPGCCACSVLSSSASPFPRRRSGRWISSNAYAQSYNDLGRDLHLAGAGDIGQSLRDNDKQGGDQLGRETKNSNTTSPNRSLDFPNVEDGHSGTGERLPRRKQDRRQRRIEGQRRALEMAQQELEHNTSQKPGRQATLQSKLSIRDRKKLRYKGFIHASKMAQLHLRPPGTWKGVRDSLHRMQQNHRVEIRKGAQQKELYIPEETVALLAGMTRTAMKENIWFAPVRNGCWVHVLDPKEGDGARRKVLLSGSSHVMELVEDHINRLREDQVNGDSLIAIRKPPIPIFTSAEAMRRKNIPVPVIRAVWHSPREKAPTKLDDFLASHTTPGTVKEFNEYIEDLICTQALSPYEKSIGRSTVPYTQRISRHLLGLFQQDSNHKLFSTAALNCALEFLCKHELLNVARFVFLRAEHVATTDTYNIFLQSAARRQDVRAFRHFMSMMSRAHLCPNSETWLALLNAMVTPRDKTDLITHMMENGYMTETSTIRTAHQLTIQDSLRVHLGNGESVDTFISLMINTHGADWFSPSLISQMFSATASMKNFEATEQLLTICKQHRFTIDSSSLNQILPMCRANVFSAINFALACMNHPSFPGFSPQTWEVLFLMAFKKRHYNICRVVWRYACMNKAVTYNMRQAVWSSLVCAEPLDESIRAQDSAWRFNAGKFIVGLDSHLKNHKVSDSVTQSLPAEFHDDPLLYLVSVPVSQSESTDRKLRTRLSRHLIDRDITLGDIRYEPGHPLGIMLESAALLDRSWKTKSHSLRWMLRKGLMVKVKTKKRE